MLAREGLAERVVSARAHPLQTRSPGAVQRWQRPRRLAPGVLAIRKLSHDDLDVRRRGVCRAVAQSALLAGWGSIACVLMLCGICLTSQPGQVMQMQSAPHSSVKGGLL